MVTITVTGTVGIHTFSITVEGVLAETAQKEMDYALKSVISTLKQK